MQQIRFNNSLIFQNRLSPTFQDPLETFESNANEISLPVPQENDDEITFKVDENVNFKNEPPPLEDVEINNFSDDEQVNLILIYCVYIRYKFIFKFIPLA